MSRLWIVAIAAIFLQSNFTICSSRKSFDFFYFVQQWPGSYCDTRRGCCYPRTGRPAADFSIHGLWPQNSDGSWPHDCNTNAQFDYSKISDLEDDLNQNWGSLSCPSSDGHKFWGHEWTKHGTCSGLDEHSYFQRALDLKKKANLLNALQSSGIVADGSEYDLESIRQAINENVGVSPKFNCNRDSDSNSQLLEVYLCVAKDATTLIDCPSSLSDSCPSKVQFPEFGYASVSSRSESESSMESSSELR